MTIQTGVVAVDFLLLLSRKSMKTAGIMIYLTSDTATIFAKSVMLNMTSSGHYLYLYTKQNLIISKNFSEK